MNSHASPPQSPPELTHMERAIIVQAIAAMRDNDPGAAPTNAQMTQGHCDLICAMEEARAAGPGSVVTHDFTALRIVYEVIGSRSTRMTLVRTAVAEPYPTQPFQSLYSLPGVRMEDRGMGVYVFDITIIQSDREALDMLDWLLQPDADVTLSDEEARSLGILPPLVQ